MKQVLVRRGDVMLEDVPAPVVSDKTVLVRTAYSVISTGTEMSVVSSSGASIVEKLTNKPELARKGWESLRTQGVRKTFATATGRDQIAVPLGYSLSGVVVEVGRGVTGFKPGDEVACAGAGLANHAEYVSVPQNLICHIPDNVTLKDSSTITLGAIALQGVRQTDLRLGETVCVSGLGLLGLLTVQLVKAGGCRVIGIDPDERRRLLALSMGADKVSPPDDRMLQSIIDSVTGGHGVDATIITAATSSNEPINQAMQFTRKKGTVVIVGAVGLKLNRSPFYEKEIDLKISCSYGPGRYDAHYEMEGEDYPYPYVRWTENRNMGAYLDLIAQGKLDLSFVTQHEFAIAEAKNAYAFLGENSGEALAAILRYDANPNDLIIKQRSLSLTTTKKMREGKVGVGLIGAGSFAVGMHLPNLANLLKESTLESVTDMNGVVAREIGSRFGAAKVSTDPEIAFGDKAIDMVMICTRHDSHADLIVRGLESHKAVFVEKPMALNSDQLAAVMAAVEQSDRQMVVGFNRRFSPLIVRIVELLKNRTSPMIIDYQMNAGYLPSDHWTQQAAGGGRNIGEACHIYDLFTCLCNSQVEKTSATSIRPTGSKYGPTDNFVTSIRFADGTVGNLTYTSMGTQKYPKEQMKIYCDGMVISLDDYRELKVFGTETKVLRLKKADKGHSELLKRFIAAVGGGEESPIPMWQLRQAAEISFDVETQLHT